MLNNRYTLQGCQNAPETGAITGYFKVFAACILLERSQKMDHSKSCKTENKNYFILIYMFFLENNLINMGNIYP